MVQAWWQRVGIVYVILYCVRGPFEAAERPVVVLTGQ